MVEGSGEARAYQSSDILEDMASFSILWHLLQIRLKVCLGREPHSLAADLV